MLFRLFVFCLLISFSSNASEKKTISIGSKRFTENFILAEIMAQLLEDKGYSVNRRFGMGGTMVTYEALKSNEIQVYPEYTGTISQGIFKKDTRRFADIQKLVAADDLKMLPPIGFNNSYCIVMKKDVAQELKIATLSDLAKFPKLVGGLSGEFQGRKDGWPTLKKKYNLRNMVSSVEIPLSYEALKSDKVDFAEAYSTEPLIVDYNFVILGDPLYFFPRYDAVALVRQDLNSEIIEILQNLNGRISNSEIMALNGKVTQGLSIPAAAQNFLVQNQLVRPQKLREDRSGFEMGRIIRQTKEHLLLTGLAVLLATLFAVPLASLFSGSPLASRFILGFTGIMQTIPSIALLTFMIPFFGIGFKPAIVGLFIYSLLPILRNTHTAMTGIDPRLIVSAKAIGLHPSEIFFSVKLPLALPTILAGIRTATILNIGTATLAAFIGAGGLGEPIVQGLALNDTNMVLQGAIPAALLAILMDGIFGLFERAFSKSL